MWALGRLGHIQTDSPQNPQLWIYCDQWAPSNCEIFKHKRQSWVRRVYIWYLRIYGVAFLCTVYCVLHEGRCRKRQKQQTFLCPSWDANWAVTPPPPPPPQHRSTSVKTENSLGYWRLQTTSLQLLRTSWYQSNWWHALIIIGSRASATQQSAIFGLFPQECWWRI